MKPLTDQQQRVLDFIKGFIATEGWTPTLDEICAGIGLSSKSTAWTHVAALERKGYLELGAPRQRTRRMRVVA